MMKKIFLIFLLLSLNFFQAQKSFNRFEEAEMEEMSTNVDLLAADDGGQVPGGPDPEPVPIDDYIPLLLITAIGIMFFNQKRQQLFRPPVKRF